MDSGSNRFWISERSYFFRKALRIFLPLFFLLALMIGAFLFFTSAPQICPETTDFITGETIQPDVFWKEDGLNAPGCVFASDLSPGQLVNKLSGPSLAGYTYYTGSYDDRAVLVRRQSPDGKNTLSCFINLSGYQDSGSSKKPFTYHYHNLSASFLSDKGVEYAFILPYHLVTDSRILDPFNGDRQTETAYSADGGLEGFTEFYVQLIGWYPDQLNFDMLEIGDHTLILKDGFMKSDGKLKKAVKLTFQGESFSVSPYVAATEAD